MQMQQIRCFLALCEERSFTRAAKRRGVSQPSLTNAIIRLEQKTWRRAFSTQALSLAHWARPRCPPVFRPGVRGRAGDGRRAEVTAYAIAAVSSQLTIMPWSVM